MAIHLAFEQTNEFTLKQFVIEPEQRIRDLIIALIFVLKNEA